MVVWIDPFTSEWRRVPAFLSDVCWIFPLGVLVGVDACMTELFDLLLIVLLASVLFVLVLMGLM